MITLKKAKVVNIKKETPTVLEIELQPFEKINFSGSQFINLVFEKNDYFEKKTIRPYSIISSKNNLKIFIRLIKDGLVSTYLHKHLKINDELEIMGPIPEKKIDFSKKYLFICGGTGIVPVMSFLNQLTNSESNVIVIYSEKTKDEILFYDQLRKLDLEKQNKILITLTRESKNWDGLTGRITPDLIKKNLTSDSLIYCYGPKTLVSFVKEQLTKLNVPKEKLDSV